MIEKLYLKAAKLFGVDKRETALYWGKKSYSQSGEDLIIRFIFQALGVKRPTYIDIGAHHPYKFNNTYLFYREGSNGINIEPDTDLFRLIDRKRRRDVNLNVGVSHEPGELDFYILSEKTLNTFSLEDAKRCEAEGISIKSVEKIAVVTLPSVVATHLDGKSPDFLTLDTEGLDEVILSGLDFSKFRPTVICVETTSYSKSLGGAGKNMSIIRLVESKGYTLYADTNINSIFVSTEVLNS